MRFAHFAALIALTSFSAQTALAQSLLSQLEQGLQSPAAAPTSGYLGAELDDEGQMGKGVLVTGVRQGTPAEKSGLKVDDLITAVDGKPVPNLDAYDAVAKRPPGTKITLTVVRGGATQALPITLGNRAAPANPADAAPTTIAPSTSPSGPSSTAPSLTPPGPAPSGAAPSLFPPTGAASPAEPAPRSSGIVAQPQTPAPQTTVPQAAETSPTTSSAATGGNASLGVTLPPPGASVGRSQRGAMIAMVRPGSPAEQAGLKAGQLIVGIDGRRIESDDDLIAQIKARHPGQSVEIQYRDGSPGSEVRTMNVRLAQAGTPAAGASAPSSAAPRSSGFSAPGGGAGSPAAPGSPPGLPLGTRLMDRVERIADNLAPRPLSTVYNPQAFADLQMRVDQLEARLRALENKAGIAPTGSAPTGGSTTAPGFNAPTNPSTTPGFGPSGGTSP
jgi:S1-C subfamily serine protease